MSSAALPLTYPQPARTLRPVVPKPASLPAPRHSPPLPQPQPPPQHLRVVEKPHEQPLEATTTPPSSSPLTSPRLEQFILAVDLPPLPYRLIGKLAVFAYEAVEGTRSVGQLGNWISAPVARSLSEYRALNVERRSLFHDTRRVVPTVQRVRVMQPVPGVAEAAVVLNVAHRSKAVALRFEGTRGHWQATSITVL